MKKRIANLWVKALRSGEFKQGRYFLENLSGENCCLGVLCNLALLEGVCDYNEAYACRYFDGQGGVLPTSVREWSGMKDNGYIASLGTGLVSLNDSEDQTFPEIADIIEKHYKEL